MPSRLAISSLVRPRPPPTGECVLLSLPPLLLLHLSPPIPLLPAVIVFLDLDVYLCVVGFFILSFQNLELVNIVYVVLLNRSKDLKNQGR